MSAIAGRNSTCAALANLESKMDSHPSTAAIIAADAVLSEALGVRKLPRCGRVNDGDMTAAG
jgi:hypothetical protein